MQLRQRLILTTALVAALGLGSLPSAGWATTATAPHTSETSYERSYADLVDRVLPAVVNVSVEREREPGTGPMGRSPFTDPDMQRFFERFFGQPLPMPQQPEPPRRARGEGSGFIIDAAGHIVTNAHVVDGAARIAVVMQDGTRHEARPVGVDSRTDLAVIKIDVDEPLPHVAFGDSTAVRVGDKVLAVGNPFGLGGTVTSGIVSATGRELGSGPYDDYLQIDAAINRGNSGGPTFDLDGRVVGVNTLIFSPSGGSVGIGFAVSSQLAQRIVAELIERGEIERGWLGVSIQSLDADLAGALGRDTTDGALVSRVEPGSPAAAAGVRQGDLILGFDGRPIERVRDLTRLVADVDPGTRTSLELIRDGQRVELEVEVGKMPGEQLASAEEPAEEGREPARLGLMLADLSAQARAEMGLEGEHGVLVREVAPDGPAAAKGIRAGDVILQINGRDVGSAREVVDAVREAHQGGQSSVMLLVARDGAQRFTAVPLAVS